ncbi:hypothetical protein Salat_0403900 [Sesamum alatum]|uniref:RING-type domain-containing protein n=1 Tax=Sesamum alatum TaxID=300844 RepID=A0AAE2D013_9LAMI|nr:hypothetical protein Salat_0403900 [Sesamum alatum]
MARSSPPLNSTNDYSIEVSLRGTFLQPPKQQPTTLPDQVRLYFDVEIDLKTSSASRKISGYGTILEFFLPSDEIFSQCKCRETMTKILDLMNMPFSLDEKQIQWKGIYNRGKVVECKSLENSQDLIRELVQVFHSISENQLYLQDNHRVFLSVRKIQTIPDDEFHEWESFRDNHPTEYFDSVHRQPELRMLFRGAALEVLERLRVEKGGGGDAVAEVCTICLEELLKDDDVSAEVIRLPCSHVYHEDCILKWLRKKQSCPCCRAKSPRIQIDNQSSIASAYSYVDF